ncbi:stage III sporulation protein AE [Clostridium baratii]|uniref:stage III sporulation protein AE n=1 Tax=Clostridium baratii TaxID=1561 RepID=UPI0009A31837|nr:stage III sporulation protein AE [Clostridium baratii]OPF51591.1 stage III sporulation protein AE [Clostridium baratii]OPF55338.1 stage III sporulation protein AE [Clostridium baratii]OPF57621.1 stage III sporulation protein AE [Clostridium baratii]OPF60281.1 stage III sporulation protein AE [Clostridium baratii]
MNRSYKKTITIILLTIVFSLIPIFSSTFYGSIASAESKSEEKILDDVTEETIGKEAEEGLNNLYSYINKMKTDVELMNELDPVEYFKSYVKNGQGNITFETITKIVLSILFKEVKSVLKLVISVIVIAILCSLLKSLQDAFKNDNISQIAFFACYSILIMILSKSFLISLSVATNAINEIANFMNALLPILVTMISLAGGFVQAATLDPIILVSVTLIPKIYVTIIIPLILISFVMQFANNLSTEYKIDNLCKLMKQTILLFQGVIITVFIAILTIRGITADTMDAVALKTTKFAVDNFIPIVGKAFSDAITSVAGYSLIIKNAITGVGLIVIVLVILYPIVKLGIMTFIYKLSSALVEPISDKRITNAISSVSEALTLLISCVISVSFMFFILLGIMASAGKFIVGG